MTLTLNDTLDELVSFTCYRLRVYLNVLVISILCVFYYISTFMFYV